MKAPHLITGGAGFIGSNLADALLSAGEAVIVFDSLARPGTERNLEWLRERHGNRLHFERGDVRDADALARVVGEAGGVFHFAAQVAVTASLDDPLADHEVNVRGTLHLLEAIRKSRAGIPVVFTSTNKVYGELGDLTLRIAADRRYEPEDDAVRAHGIAEDRPLDFRSPYGCSKGAADQYVIDYARSYGIPAVVLRMSCIYGPRQLGTEDQGWVAHFVRRALAGEAVTVYGDGRQVRDLLHVDDLVAALRVARRAAQRMAGSAFNIGGGTRSTLSLRELLGLLEEFTGRAVDVDFGPWRCADQRYYVSDTRRFSAATGWEATVPLREGMRRLHDWMRENADPATAVLPRVAGGEAS